jgi:Arc/MetJ-type ribon-helix-helix transcriptional regulator
MATVLGAEIMWGLAAYADRVNEGQYIKEAQRDDNNDVVRNSNRDIIRSQAAAGLPDVTEDDLELGRQARTWHRGNLVFKALRGQPLSDFDLAVQEAVQKEEFSNRSDALSAAVVASQISSYRKGLAQQQLEASVDRTPLAAVGAKVSVDATVVRTVFSQNYGVHFVTARTQCNRLVFFSFREELAAGTPIRVRGTVKAHRPDSTQLNRVKLV